MKCLEKDRAWRYETANGLAMDVKRFLTDEPVVARPPSRIYRFKKAAHRNRLAFAAGAAIVATLIPTNCLPLSFSPNGAFLAAGVGNELVLLETGTWRLINVLRGHRGDFYGVAFSPDGKMLASASQNETIRLWDPAATNLQNPFHQFPDDVFQASLSTGGRYVGMSHRTGKLSLWDTVTMCKMREWPGLEFEGFTFAVLSPDGSRAAFAFGDGSIHLAETVEAKTIASWPAHTHVDALCFSDDTSLLASVGADRKVRLWELATHQERWTASLSNYSSYFSIAISARNELLCVGEVGGAVRVWDTRTGKQTHCLDSHKEWILDLASSSDARTLHAPTLARFLLRLPA